MSKWPGTNFVALVFFIKKLLPQKRGCTRTKMVKPPVYSETIHTYIHTLIHTGIILSRQK